ncbi:MAG: DUF362 domain-containing protein [Promethearchaeota archaeon]
MRTSLEFEGRIIITDKVYNKKEFNTFLSDINITPPFIVKPNWISEDYGHYTDAEVLKWLLQFLSSKGQVVLTESYSARNSINLPITGYKKLTEQDLKKIRESESDFLIRTGIHSLLQDLDIEYINVTEEVLAQRIVDPDLVSKEVTALYNPIFKTEFYSFVPEKLYKLREGTFINLAKFKIFFSMCVKNIFGMIPEYVGNGSRFHYHGKNDINLASNIIDINKIYHTLFNVVGLVEGINTLTCNRRGISKPYKAKFGYEYYVSENNGLIYYGNETHWLDAFIHQQSGKNPSQTEHLSKAADVFGKWPSKLIEDAKRMDDPLNVET